MTSAAHMLQVGAVHMPPPPPPPPPPPLFSPYTQPQQRGQAIDVQASSYIIGGLRV